MKGGAFTMRRFTVVSGISILWRGVLAVLAAMVPVSLLAQDTAVCGEPKEFTEAAQGLGKRRKEVSKNSYYSPLRWDLDSLPEYQPSERVSGLIRMWGSNYVGQSNLAKYWEEGFRKYHPSIKFEYHLLNALVAIPALSMGVADLAPGRHATWAELLLFQRVFGYPPVEISMATGSFNVEGFSPAMGIFVNKDNPISKLTLKQLDGIFGAARTGGYQGIAWHPEIARGADQNIRTWGQAGLIGEWKNKPIHVYGLNLRLQAVQNFERLVFKGGAKWTESLREYANCITTTGTPSYAAEQPLKDLGNDPYGITYSGVATAQTKALAIAAKDGEPYVEFTIENVHNRTYPLFVEEYMYVNHKPGQPMDPKLNEYLKYIVSREGQKALARDGKYLPLTAEVAREQLKKLQ